MVDSLSRKLSKSDSITKQARHRSLVVIVKSYYVRFLMALIQWWSGGFNLYVIGLQEGRRTRELLEHQDRNSQQPERVLLMRII